MCVCVTARVRLCVHACDSFASDAGLDAGRPEFGNSKPSSSGRNRRVCVGAVVDGKTGLGRVGCSSAPTLNCLRCVLVMP